MKKVKWSTVPLELTILLGQSRCPELIPTMKKTMNEMCEKN